LRALGKLFELQGKYEDSLESYTRAITIRENLLGSLHPDTARLYLRLGELELSRENKTAAKEAFKKAWDAYEDAYGSENEETVSAKKAYENC
jgi:tetratricopeptide (TPR) repeat protein